MAPLPIAGCQFLAHPVVRSSRTATRVRRGGVFVEGPSMVHAQSIAIRRNGAALNGPFSAKCGQKCVRGFDHKTLSFSKNSLQTIGAPAVIIPTSEYPSTQRPPHSFRPFLRRNRDGVRTFIVHRIEFRRRYKQEYAAFPGEPSRFFTAAPDRDGHPEAGDNGGHARR